MREVVGIYRGIEVRAERDMLNLTNMWKACGGNVNKQPAMWSRTDSAKELISAAKSKSANMQVWTSKKGRCGGTFAHPVIGLAYAKYLSPEFHIWGNEQIIQKGLVQVHNGDLLVKTEEAPLPALSRLTLTALPTRFSPGSAMLLQVQRCRPV